MLNPFRRGKLTGHSTIPGSSEAVPLALSRKVDWWGGAASEHVPSGITRIPMNHPYELVCYVLLMLLTSIHPFLGI